MIALDIEHKGSSLSLELPLPIEVLAGELRMLGIGKTLNQIRQDDFTLTPMNELGEHFMKLVQPDDTLGDIAVSCRELDVLAGDSRQALVDLIMTDRFRDLDHMADYLQHGPAALTHLIRLRIGDTQVDLPCDTLHILLKAAGYDRSFRQIRLNEVEYQPLNDQGRELLTKCSPYESIGTANLACALLATPTISASMSEVMESANRLLEPMPREELRFFCPMYLKLEAGDEGELEEADPGDLIYHEDDIHSALAEYGDMADHLPDDLRQKVASVTWGATKIGPALYGCVSCELRAPLSPQETNDLAGWITEMNSEGVFRDFEQEPFETEYESLYVGLWRDSDDYYLLPEDEFRTQVLGEQAQGFGGMGAMSG